MSERKVIPVLCATWLLTISIIISINGCASFSGKSIERNGLNTLIAATQTYFEYRKVLELLKPSIPADYWNDKIVPVDNRIYDGLDTAYNAIKLYNATKDDLYLKEYNAAIQEVIRLLPVFKRIADEAPKEEKPA